MIVLYFAAIFSASCALSIPTREPDLCKNGRIENGFIEVNERNLNRGHVTCMEGFQITGKDKTAHCENGRWKIQVECVQKRTKSAQTFGVDSEIQSNEKYQSHEPSISSIKVELKNVLEKERVKRYIVVSEGSGGEREATEAETSTESLITRPTEEFVSDATTIPTTSTLFATKSKKEQFTIAPKAATENTIRLISQTVKMITDPATVKEIQTEAMYDSLNSKQVIEEKDTVILGLSFSLAVFIILLICVLVCVVMKKYKSQVSNKRAENLQKSKNSSTAENGTKNAIDGNETVKLIEIKPFVEAGEQQTKAETVVPAINLTDALPVAKTSVELAPSAPSDSSDTAPTALSDSAVPATTLSSVSCAPAQAVTSNSNALAPAVPAEAAATEKDSQEKPEKQENQIPKPDDLQTTSEPLKINIFEKVAATNIVSEEAATTASDNSGHKMDQEITTASNEIKS